MSHVKFALVKWIFSQINIATCEIAFSCIGKIAVSHVNLVFSHLISNFNL